MADEIRRLVAETGRAICILDSDPSHDEFLKELITIPDIEWTRVICFHTYERLGASEDSPNSSRRFLIDRLVMKVPIAEFHGLRGEARNPDAVCANYAELLRTRPPDFAVVAIGENGRPAFADPGNCDLDDTVAVKVTNLSISLTIPTILACKRLFLTTEG